MVIKMPDKIKVGILGLGAISNSHINYLISCERAELYAICDRDEPWLAHEKARLGVKYACADYNELLRNPEIDAVIIALPTVFHAEVTIKALEAGKHVLCQKPMACSAAEARAMCAAGGTSGKKLMISHNQRMEPAVQNMKRLNDEGFFGDIYVVRLGWRRPLGMMPSPLTVRKNGEVYSRNWFNEADNGGGVLRDLGTHLLDLALYITDFPEMAEASCSLYRKFKPDLPAEELEKYRFDSEDMAIGHVKFKNGLSMQLEFSFGSMIEKEKIITEVYGTKAGASRQNDMLTLITPGLKSVSVEHASGLRSHMTANPTEAFLDCIINDTEPFVTGRQGLRVVEILDALYASAKGKMVL